MTAYGLLGALVYVLGIGFALFVIMIFLAAWIERIVSLLRNRRDQRRKEKHENHTYDPGIGADHQRERGQYTN